MKLSELYKNYPLFLQTVKDVKMSKYKTETNPANIAQYIIDDLMWGDKFADKISDFLVNCGVGYPITENEIQSLVTFCFNSEENPQAAINKLTADYLDKPLLIGEVEVLATKSEPKKEKKPYVNRFLLSRSFISLTNQSIKLGEEFKKYESGHYYNREKLYKIEEKIKVNDTMFSEVSEKIVNEESKLNLNYLIENGYGDFFLDYF